MTSSHNDVSTSDDEAWRAAVEGAPMVGASPAHAALLDRLRRIAATDAPTLIEGETGSGKEVAARVIHYGGARRDGPFVPVNCGALPDALVESELFGVERGAFTDARHARRGLVSEASRGTLFLDEVDALSAKAQVTLLRFLQDQRYRPLGGTRELCTDVRVIAATNRPLEALVAQQAFRADLMYRLKILHAVMPPLRERGDDIDRLAEHFVADFAVKYARPPVPLHPKTLAWMHEYGWAGNVRELENWIHRQFLMTGGDAILHDAHANDAATAMAPTVSGGFAQAKAEAVRRFECGYLRRVLDDAGGNVSRAARMAGKERRAFGKLLRKHGIAGHASD